MNKLIKLDSKGRIALGDLAKGIEYFDITKYEDGTIILTPMVLIPVSELERYKRLEESMKESVNG